MGTLVHTKCSLNIRYCHSFHIDSSIYNSFKKLGTKKDKQNNRQNKQLDLFGFGFGQAMAFLPERVLAAEITETKSHIHALGMPTSAFSSSCCGL